MDNTSVQNQIKIILLPMSPEARMVMLATAYGAIKCNETHIYPATQITPEEIKSTFFKLVDLLQKLEPIEQAKLFTQVAEKMHDHFYLGLDKV